MPWLCSYLRPSRRDPPQLHRRKIAAALALAEGPAAWAEEACRPGMIFVQVGEWIPLKIIDIELSF